MSNQAFDDYHEMQEKATNENTRIDRVWAVLNEQDCLPYSSNVSDITSEERPLTEGELAELKVMDKESEQQNRAFCRRIVEAASDFHVSTVGNPLEDFKVRLDDTLAEREQKARERAGPWKQGHGAEQEYERRWAWADGVKAAREELASG